MATPLLKVPLLISGALCQQLASTPPNPPARRSERPQIDVFSDIITRSTARGVQRLVQAVIWTGTLCEVVAIVATKIPSPLSSRLLSLLLPSSPPSPIAIRITPTFLAGWTLLCSGSLLRLSCYRHLGRFFTFDVSLKDNHRLVQTGPYAIVRHPAYVGTVLRTVGTLACFLGGGSWCAEGGVWDSAVGRVCIVAWTAWMVFLPVKLIARVSQEERVMKNRFGGEWEAYARRTRYKLIPWLY